MNWASQLNVHYLVFTGVCSQVQFNCNCVEYYTSITMRVLPTNPNGLRHNKERTQRSLSVRRTGGDELGRMAMMKSSSLISSVFVRLNCVYIHNCN